MGLFSRNKGQQQRQASASPPPPLGPTSAPPAPILPLVHPPSYLSASSPQPQPSPAQYQQQLFHQTYQYLQSQQPPLQGPGGPYPGGPNAQLLYAQQPPYHQHPLDPDGYAAAVAAGAGAGADGSSAMFHQAVMQAAREGKPLKLDFIAQMEPVMANSPYGVSMPHQHPYGPPYDGPPGSAPPGWQPGLGQDPYDAIRIPALPDMRTLPAELQDFRDQCATGVRQAVAMVTAMEHQLWWERSRRQQAEEDCKVLLAAVHAERGVGEALMGAEERRRADAITAAGKLTLAADELPQASDAATTIQKHVRGRLARKEFETHLRDILRGVDPSLDPAALPAGAQAHVSHVNATGAPRRLGLRTLLGEVVDKSSGGAVPTEQADAATYYRRQVDRIGQRLAGHKDAGEPHPGDRSGDPLLADVKQLLSGTYPASSAQVIGALVRRCRELQSALLEAVGELEEAQLSIQGLKEANAQLSELSHVRADLEATRHDNLRLAANIAKLRTVVSVQAAGSNAGAARENPFVAAWYRKAYADKEWQRVPPGGPGGVALMDGPDNAVETWDDLRASMPEPVLVPRVSVPGNQYRDLLGLKQDMIMAAGRGPPDPLYSMPVPDRSSFMYERDTPLVPMQSAMPLIRETLPPDTFMGVHDDIYRRTPRPSAPGVAAYPGRDAGGNLLPSSAINLGGRGQSQGAYQQLLEQQERMRQQAAFEAAHGAGSLGGAGSAPGSGGGAQFQYNRDTPVVPVYSVLPLIREDEFVRRSTSPARDTPLQQPGTPHSQAYQTQQPGTPHSQQSYRPQQQGTPHPQTYQPQQQQQPQQQGMQTNLQYIRDRAQAPPPPPEAVAAAAVAMTRPQQVGNGMVGPGPVMGQNPRGGFSGF